jgi:hypothetical protein
MSDEIRLTSELTTDTYSNSVGNKITVVKLQNNVLMTAKEIAKLYGVSRPYITMKLRRLYLNKTLSKKRVSNILTHRADDGKLYETRYYNTEAIIALGLSIKSPEAEAFQQWIGASAPNKPNQNQISN